MKLLLSILILSMFRTNIDSATNKKYTKKESYIEFINYETSEFNGERFDIRIAYKFYPNGMIEVFNKLYQKYEYFTLSGYKKLYPNLLSLGNNKLETYKVKKQLANGMHYAGGYSYFAIQKENVRDEICYITPIMSERFKTVIEQIYAIDTKNKKTIVAFDAKKILQAIESKVMKIHHISKPPKSLPTPPSK